jgi:Fe-S-cluster containining protein
VAKPHLGELPVFQNYDCCGCGACCRGNLAISVTDEEAERIVAQGWEREPDLAGRRFFLERGTQRFLAHRDDGACVFLGADGHCRIHARFGSEGKPLGCRYFPHVFLPAGGEIRVDLRFECHRVAANLGEPIAAQRAYLEAMLPLIVPRLDPEPTPLMTGVSWPQSRLDRITEAMLTLLLDEELNVTQRVCACINLTAALHHPSLMEKDAAGLDALLARALAMVSEAAARDPLHRARLGSGPRTMFRHQIALYGRVDRLAEPTPWTRRLRQALAMTWGRGRVPSLRRDWPRVRFADLEGAWGVPDAACAEPLVRFLHVKLQSQAFCGLGFFGYLYLSGLEALWITYPAILWFARFFARGAGRESLEAEDVHQALRVVDHRHGRSEQMALPGEQARLRALCEREVLRALAVWYGT